MDYINELIQSIPYPVIFKDSLDSPTCIGRWRPKNGVNQSSIIEIRNNQNECGILTTLLHEIGHSKCSENNCKCAEVVSSEGELHAYIFTLGWLLKRKHKKALKYEMNHIISMEYREDFYGEAARKLMLMPLWKQCKRFTKHKQLLFAFMKLFRG